MSQRNFSLFSRLLLGAIGMFSLIGGVVAFANVINGDGSLLWNVIALVNALAVCTVFLGVAIQRQG